jgi:hypothetical protein
MLSVMVMFLITNKLYRKKDLLQDWLKKQSLQFKKMRDQQNQQLISMINQSVEEVLKYLLKPMMIRTISLYLKKVTISTIWVMMLLEVLHPLLLQRKALQLALQNQQRLMMKR